MSFRCGPHGWRHLSEKCPACPELPASDIEQIGKLSESVAIECMAQLTRFVQRKNMTSEEAAKLAWDLALAFGIETAERLKQNG